jgi:hypothetical protein
VTIFRGMARGKQPTKPAQIDTRAAGGFLFCFFPFPFPFTGDSDLG